LVRFHIQVEGSNHTNGNLVFERFCGKIPLEEPLGEETMLEVIDKEDKTGCE
jgi:hypothetical protein